MAPIHEPKPRHPNSRAVVAIEAEGAGGLMTLKLECGHRMRRRYGCVPSRAICEQC